LVGYAIIDDYFPSDAEVFKFHWDKDIKADYILYIRLESQSKVAIHPPFEIRQIEERGGYYKKALIYFYVDKRRAVKCYDLIK